jgi:hypothetical protein
MKRWIAASFFGALLVLGMNRPAFAYFGFQFGLQDDAHFGYGMNFGFYMPENLGLDVQLVSTWQDKGLINQYFIQENISLFYDFNHLLAPGNKKLEPLHPYAKLGFSYGTAILTGVTVGAIDVGGRLNHGPGLVFGVGADWRLNRLLSIGLDINESILWLGGTTVNGTVIVPDDTNYGFNLLLTFKFYDL